MFHYMLQLKAAGTWALFNRDELNESVTIVIALYFTLSFCIWQEAATSTCGIRVCKSGIVFIYIFDLFHLVADLLADVRICSSSNRWPHIHPCRAQSLHMSGRQGKQAALGRTGSSNMLVAWSWTAGHCLPAPADMSPATRSRASQLDAGWGGGTGGYWSLDLDLPSLVFEGCGCTPRGLSDSSARPWPPGVHP